jgi:hypothetical protein
MSITIIIAIIITIISITNIIIIIIIIITCIYHLFVDRKEKQYAAVLEKIQPLHHQQQEQSGQQQRPKSANNATSSSNYSFPSSRERKKPILTTTTTTTTTTDNTTTPPSSSAKHHDKSKPRPYSARASLKPKVPKLSRNNSDDWDSRVYNFISPYGTSNDYNSALVSNNMKPPLSIYDQRREFVTSYVKIYNEAESSRKKTMDHDNKGTYCR